MGARAGNAPARAATRWLVLGGTLLVATLLGACEFIYDVPVQVGTDASVVDSALDRKVPADVARKKDSTSADAGADRDAGAPDMGAPEAAMEATVYHLFANGTQWSTFDTTSVNSNALGFTGGTFDGRYVYLAPNSTTVAARYDTTATFTSNGSWGTFDVKPLLDALPRDAGPDASPDAASVDSGTNAPFYGSAFDGKYVYLLPGNGPPAFAARFDTKGTFTSAGSWETYDLAPLAGGNAYGFGGGTFDGTYVYMVPSSTSILARFDTTSSFSAPGAGWTTFDMSTLSDGGAAPSFTGAVFDGRYVYLVPGSYGSVAMRYDTHGPISSATSWSSYDTSVLNFNAYGFAGGAFDGKYVYFVPNVNGVVVRYDTTAGAFSSTASWAFFNSTRVKLKAKGYFGAGFDGRFIYFVPDVDPSFYYYSYTPSGLAVRYDTTQSFFAVTSWTTFDVSTLANAEGFSGAVFDGQYMYFVPYNNSSFDGIVARFDAKTPRSMPKLPDFHGSFF